MSTKENKVEPFDLGRAWLVFRRHYAAAMPIGGDEVDRQAAQLVALSAALDGVAEVWDASVAPVARLAADAALPGQVAA